MCLSCKTVAKLQTIFYDFHAYVNRNYTFFTISAMIVQTITILCFQARNLFGNCPAVLLDRTMTYLAYVTNN